MLRPFVTIAAAAGLLWVAGCTDYASQSDGLYHGAGYAMQQNMMIQRANPYGRYGGATQIDTDGKRAVAVMKKHSGTNGGAAAPAAAPPIALPGT